MVSLRERLAQRNSEELRRVAEHWGIRPDGSDEQPDAGRLAERMAADTPARTAFDRLEQPEKEALRAMASAAHKGWVATADVRRLTGIPDSHVADLARSLEGKGVAFCEERELPAENPYWGPTWAGRRLPTRPTPVLALADEVAPLFLDIIGEFAGSSWYAEVPSPLNRLETLSLDTLQAMAGHYGVSPNGVAQTPARLAARLQPALKDASAVWQVIQALPERLRAMLDAVEAAGGRLPVEEARERFAASYEDLHRIVAELTERGLAFDRFVHRSRVLLAPDRVLECLAQHTLPEVPPARLLPVAPPPTEHRLNQDLQWALLQLLRHIRLEGLSRTATTHVVPKRIADRLAAQSRYQPVDREPSEWVEQQILYLAAVGVLPSAAQLRLEEPEPAWLRQDAFAQARMLFERWLAGHVEDLRQERCSLGLWMDHTALAAGRELLADLLRRCRPGEWMSVDSLLRTAAATRPFFLRERDRVVRQQGYRGLKRMLVQWFQVEGRALLLHLTGLPLELGMVALDRPLPAGETAPPDAAFCLTEKGAALLGMAPAPTAADERALVVQPNFEVVAMEFVPGILDELGQFATPVGCDRVATYRIERQGVNLALANGWSGERLVEFLREHARQPVPQNVEQSLRGWASAIRRARFVRAIVVESDDPGVLEDLAATKMLRGRVRGIARGAVLLVEPDTDLSRIARDLRPEGFVLEADDE